MRRGIRTLIFTMLAISVGLWAAEDPLMRTWKINLAKSNFGSGAAPKSQVIKLEPAGPDGLHHNEDVVNAQGETHHNEYTAQFGGNGNPIQGDPNRDTIVLKRIDAHTMEILNMKAGKVVSQYHRGVSKDGKTMTTTFTRPDAQGRPTKGTLVFDKQ